MNKHIDDIKRQILDKLDVRAEMSNLRFTNKFSDGGKLAQCHSFQRPDKKPSCYVTIEGEYKGFYYDHATDLSMPFWNFQMEAGQCGGMEFLDTLKFFADKVGVPFEPHKKGKGKKAKASELGPITKIYEYRDLEGSIVLQVCRYDEPTKTFRQRRPKPGIDNPDSDNPKDWLWSVDKETIIPYRLKEMSEAGLVFNVEGERDADSVTALGLPGTCGPMGSGKWWDNFNQYYKGKHVAILPDNDTEGRKHAHLVARELSEVAASIRILELPGLPKKGDVSDWIEAGGTKEQLLGLLDQVEPIAKPNDIVAEFNKHHAVTWFGSQFLVIKEPLLAEDSHLYITLGNLKNAYANRFVPNPLEGKGQPDLITVAEYWFQHKDRRQYDRIVFAPHAYGTDDPTPKNNYNLWTGLAVEPKQGEWDKMQSHIYYTVCGGVEGYYQWLMGWIAYLVQNPGGPKVGTMPVLKGIQGAGKGIFVQAILSWFGRHGLHITNRKHLTGNFNAHFEQRVFAFVDEATWGGDVKEAGALKALITEPKHIIERKGKDAVSVDNHMTFCIAGNEDWLVPVSLEERRFFCLAVSGKNAGNRKYFGDIVAESESGGNAAFLYDMLNWDYSKVDLRVAPKTQAGFDQTLETMLSPEQYWFDRLRVGYQLESDGEYWNMENTSKEAFFEEYLTWMRKTLPRRTPYNNVHFWRTLRTKLDIPMKEGWGGRQRVVTFEGLTVCREHFEGICGREIGWDYL